jgi:hypothetical protein
MANVSFYETVCLILKLTEETNTDSEPSTYQLVQGIGHTKRSCSIAVIYTVMANVGGGEAIGFAVCQTQIRHPPFSLNPHLASLLKRVRTHPIRLHEH